MPKPEEIIETEGVPPLEETPARLLQGESTPEPETATETGVTDTEETTEERDDSADSTTGGENSEEVVGETGEEVDEGEAFDNTAGDVEGEATVETVRDKFQEENIIKR